MVDLMGKAYGHNKLLFMQHNLNPDFFDLSSKLAGEVLHKLSTYRLTAAFVVNVSDGSTKFKEMVNEANMGTQFRFFADEEAAVKWLEQND